MLISTYRLQLNAEFTLDDARQRVPYLRALGVSHLYLSPVLAAREGSTHGYDVTDPTQVSAALGGDDAFVALANEAHAHEMGIVLDIVPNHMGIGADNPFWDDLLAHGRGSRYADWFDVTWRAPARRLEGKVLVPILGDTLEKVIARGEITLDASGDAVRVRYFDHHFPLDPDTIPPELRRDPSAWTAGDEGRRRLAKLLGAQHYELAFWRAAQRDVNYRRFFDVNDLVCLRVEQRDVFEATHRTVLRFVADGLVDGLRVDHIDGLLVQRRYLERLRSAVDERRPAQPGAPRFPIFVEKILASGEALHADWPVDGTTGYEFMTTLEDVFIDEQGYAQVESRYVGRGDRAVVNFAHIARSSKRRVLRGALNADVRRIAPMLADVARRAGWPNRPIAAYAGAIVELTAALPVYRTYIDAESPDASGADREVLEAALGNARAAAHVDADAITALERVLLDPWREAEPTLGRARLAFVLRWQQLTGPAAAKGVEDTALYVYAPLTSRNEVGGDPGQPLAGAVTRLHARLAERAERHPRSLNATNTHDTKRSADARARIDALSEHATEWERALRRWRRRHRALRSAVKGRLLPTRAEEDFIHQSLLGVWPLTGAELSGDAWVVELRERLAGYLQKAMREAKIGTSWTDPVAEYEAAITQFLARLLDRASPESLAYIDEMQRLVARIAPQAMWNALGRLVVHLTAPGVPDLYQGDELWYAALVDPDNRRPVDWLARERVLADVMREREGGGALAAWRDAMRAGELKMHLTRTLLGVRRDPDGPLAGSFEPLPAHGTRGDRVIAYQRSHAGQEAIIMVGRRLAALGPRPLGEAWGDTALRVSDGSRRCAIHGGQVTAPGGLLRVADVFRELPVAVLLRG
jgi:(1->4)-alpha-D-glucan 1-alpha-D-glucosylmutase